MIFASPPSVSRRGWIVRVLAAAAGTRVIGRSVADDRTAAGPKIASMVFDLRREALSLWWRDEAGRPFRTFDALEQSLKASGRRLVFAMNAGMYEADFSPVGLFIANGREERPLNRRDGAGNFYLKPNGVFHTAADGTAGIVETMEMAAHRGAVSLATQSGPLLVRKGVIHAGFNPRSSSRLIRNGVGVRDRHTVVFAISEEPVNFHEFAIHFRDVLRCPDALYLDGTISSVLSTAPPLRIVRAELGPILALTARI